MKKVAAAAGEITVVVVAVMEVVPAAAGEAQHDPAAVSSSFSFIWDMSSQKVVLECPPLVYVGVVSAASAALSWVEMKCWCLQSKHSFNL